MNWMPFVGYPVGAIPCGCPFTFARQYVDTILKNCIHGVTARVTPTVREPTRCGNWWDCRDPAIPAVLCRVPRFWAYQCILWYL